MIEEALKTVKQFSRETGIVDRNVDLILEGLAAYPSREFLFTPLMTDPIYYALTADDLDSFGRGIGVLERPRGRGVMSGISASDS